MASSFRRWPRFRKNGLTLDVPISWVTLPSTIEDDRLFPVIKITELVSSLGRVGCLNKLFGDRAEATIQDELLEFWRRFSTDTPDHEVFQASAAGLVSLQRSIPVMVHGDEGRSYKKKGVMLVSVQGVLGVGTRPFVQRFKDSRERSRRMGLNIGGHSLGSRFLFAAMLKKHYEKPAACQ